MEYPHKTILLNKKRVSVQKIIDGTIKGTTPFEISTLTFISSWLRGQERFQLKTSGSTGTPKRITATRHQLIQSAKLTLQALSIKRGGKILLSINPEYIGGKMMLVRAFVNEMKIEATEPAGFNQHTEMPSNISLAAFVPVQIHAILNSRQSIQSLKKIKNILIGGAPLSTETLSSLRKIKTNMYATYGMTETLSHIALRRISPTLENAFHVLPSIRIAADSRGCLIVKAPFLKKKIITNDIVAINGELSFEWLGRVDLVINSGGIKVIPEQLEIQIQKIANKLAIINRFYIIGEPDKKLGEKITLVLEGNKLAPLTAKLFLNKLKAELLPYHAPKKIKYVQQFTLVNNKIKRE